MKKAMKIILIIIGIVIITLISDNSLFIKRGNLDKSDIKASSKLTWEEITEDGVNEELLLKNTDVETLEIIAIKLQSLAKTIGEREKADSEYVLRAGWLEDYPASEEYNYVINLGDLAMKPLYLIIYKSDNQGLYEYLCARALEQISNEEYDMWSTSKEFLEKFNKLIIEKNKH